MLTLDPCYAIVSLAFGNDAPSTVLSPAVPFLMLVRTCSKALSVTLQASAVAFCACCDIIKKIDGGISHVAVELIRRLEINFLL